MNVRTRLRTRSNGAPHGAIYATAQEFETCSNLNATPFAASLYCSQEVRSWQSGLSALP